MRSAPDAKPLLLKVNVIRVSYDHYRPQAVADPRQLTPRLIVIAQSRVETLQQRIEVGQVIR